MSDHEAQVSAVPNVLRTAAAGQGDSPFEHARGILDRYYGHGMRNDAVDIDGDARQLLLDLAARQAAPEIVADGASLIADERRRQVEAEGWTPEHDAEHGGGEMVRAAICYATPHSMRDYRSRPAPGSTGDRGDRTESWPVGWPWAARYWKPRPTDRVRELVKAGALIAAEIDRLAATVPPSPLAVGNAVETAEQLDALPDGAILRAGLQGLVMERIDDRWWGVGNSRPVTAVDFLPAVVLHLAGAGEPS